MLFNKQDVFLHKITLKIYKLNSKFKMSMELTLILNIKSLFNSIRVQIARHSEYLRRIPNITEYTNEEDSNGKDRMKLRQFTIFFTLSLYLINYCLFQLNLNKAIRTSNANLQFAAKLNYLESIVLAFYGRNLQAEHFTMASLCHTAGAGKKCSFRNKLIQFSQPFPQLRCLRLLKKINKKTICTLRNVNKLIITPVSNMAASYSSACPRQ